MGFGFVMVIQRPSFERFFCSHNRNTQQAEDGKEIQTGLIEKKKLFCFYRKEEKNRIQFNFSLKILLQRYLAKRKSSFSLLSIKLLMNFFFRIFFT